jgi:hypothetical protein
MKNLFLYRHFRIEFPTVKQCRFVGVRFILIKRMYGTSNVKFVEATFATVLLFILFEITSKIYTFEFVLNALK